MDHIQRFGEILIKERTSDVIPFLASLDAKERKQLLPKLKELYYVWEYNSKTVQSGGFSYQQMTTPKGTEKQKTIWAVGSFFCHSQSEFGKNTGVHSHLTKSWLDQILPVYCPPWFQAYVNDTKSESWATIRLNYIELLGVESQGYVELGPEIVARTIPVSIVDSDPKDWKVKYFRPERLWQYSITLEKHIWHLFEHPSALHWSDNDQQFANFEGKNAWRSAFKLLAEQKRIDRQRLLKETLLAMNRNFDKNASGWFADLLLDLDPVEDEIMALQTGLLAQFTSPHSKVINSALKLIKKIQDNPRFNANDFIVSCGLLLSSDTKSIVQSCLIILDRLAKNKPTKQLECCHVVVQAFISQDNDLQVRAARFIEKYSGVHASAILDEILPYQDTLMLDARNILSAALKTDTLEQAVVNEDEHDISPAISGELLPFEVPNGFDEFLFLASQAFDNNEPHHFDMLLAGVLGNHTVLTEGQLDKLEPAVQRALKKLTDNWTANMGFLDNMMSNFFVEYCDRYGAKAATLKKMINEARKKDLETAKNNKYYSQRILSIENWRTEGNTPVYFLFRELCVTVLKRVRREEFVPLLSTPTHLPCWVNGEVLTERVLRHQTEDVEINQADLQIALARCKKQEAVPQGLEKVTGELGALLKYHFSVSDTVPNDLQYGQAWIVSAIARGERIPESLLKVGQGRLHEDYYTGEFNWSVRTSTIKDKRYDYVKGKYIEFDNTRTEIRVQRPKRIEMPAKPARFFGLIKPKEEVPHYPMSVYGSQLIKERGVEGIDNDIARFMSLLPNNPSPLIVSIVEKVFRYAESLSETEKRLLTRSLEFLANNWTDWGKTPNEFLGIVMACSDKTCRTMAGEIWVSGVMSNTVRNGSIGQAIGTLYAGNFAPIKRFSDLALTIYAVSPKHKKAMFEVLRGCLVQLPHEPVRNLKKLLELLKETVYEKERVKSDLELMVKLDGWKNSDGLKKLVESIVQA